MAKTPQNLTEWTSHYEELREKAYWNYQQTGEGRYDKAVIKYDVILDGLRAKAQLDEEDREKYSRRIANRNKAIDGLEFKDTYTREEVIALLQAAVYW